MQKHLRALAKWFSWKRMSISSAHRPTLTIEVLEGLVMTMMEDGYIFYHIKYFFLKSRFFLNSVMKTQEFNGGFQCSSYRQVEVNFDYFSGFLVIHVYKSFVLVNAPRDRGLISGFHFLYKDILFFASWEIVNTPLCKTENMMEVQWIYLAIQE